MSKKSSISLLLILLSQPHLLHAWGGGDKLSDGSCQFDKETGYTGSSFYIKSNEGFVVVNGGDSRYGATSIVYDATTCKKITSGDSDKSQFGNLFSRKGFENISIDSNKLMDREFQNLVTFSQNSDNISIKLTPISLSVTSKLNALLMPLSDKSASSSISISDEIQTFIRNEGFGDAFNSKINELNADNINFNYALALNSKIYGTSTGGKPYIARKYFVSSEYKTFAKQASSDFSNFIANIDNEKPYTKLLKYVDPILSVSEGDRLYNITIQDKSKKYPSIDYSISKNCNTTYANQQTKREVDSNGEIYNRSYRDKVFKCYVTPNSLGVTNREQLNSFLANASQKKGYSYSSNFAENNNLIADINNESVGSKYVGIDSAVNARYKQRQAEEAVRDERRRSCKNTEIACEAQCGGFVSGYDLHNSSMFQCKNKCRDISCD